MRGSLIQRSISTVKRESCPDGGSFVIRSEADRLRSNLFPIDQNEVLITGVQCIEEQLIGER